MSAIEQSPILRKGSYNQVKNGRNHNTLKMVSKKNHDYRLSILCALFGIGTWLPINAIYTQMPIFINSAPESWSLPSYFSLLVQITNIAPLVYYCFRKRLVFSQSFLICTFLGLGTLSIFFMSFTYQSTAVIFGYAHSVWFFFFSIFAAALGCISSVLFLPFMQKLPELYLVPFFIGEGLSGLLPGLIAVMQDIDTEICHNGKLERITPRFSTVVFFQIISCIMVLSTLAFVYLNYFSNFVEEVELTSTSKNYNTEKSSTRRASQTISKNLFVSLLLVQTVVNCFSNGILPSIQPYSAASYGEGPYHWSVLLNLITSPLVMYVAFFVPFVSTRMLSLSVTVLTLCITYEVVTATLRPPPMTGTSAGAIIIVFVWMISSGLTAYTKLSIASIFRRKHESALINYGMVTQVGSTLGAALSFVLINYLHIFEKVAVKKQCS